VKNSSTSFVVLEIILLLAFTLVSPVEGGKKKPQNPEDLTNFLLSPRYSQWLVGPVALIATAEERSAYLRLQEDEEATAFIVSFWDKRGGDSVFSTNGEKAIFDERAQEADRVFGEGTFRGHRTDRGTIFVLYGDPEEIRFEAAPRGRGEFMEIWEYPKEAEEGLDGKKPEKFYRFVKKDGKTTFYRGPVGRQIPGNSVRQ
jgi:GWxTD domain-containing protein